MTQNIHPTAIIADGAEIASTAKIGPYCVVGEHAVIADEVELKSHVVVDGRTSIGKGTVIHPFASIGGRPQDLKFNGEPSTLEIGEYNQIREYVTMNPGTEGGGMVTRVGNKNLFMMGVHVGHDAIVGNHVIMANQATLAGHVEVGDFALLGGLSAVHQFVRIGHHAVIGGMTGVEHDVIPYGSVMGERGSLAGLNLVGLKRHGYSRDAIHALRHAYKTIFEPSTDDVLATRVSNAEKEWKDSAEVMDVLSFIRNAGSRQLCVPKHE